MKDLKEGDIVELDSNKAKVILIDERREVIYLKINEKIVAITFWLFEHEVNKGKFNLERVNANG